MCINDILMSATLHRRQTCTLRLFQVNFNAILFHFPVFLFYFAEFHLFNVVRTSLRTSNCTFAATIWRQHRSKVQFFCLFFSHLLYLMPWLARQPGMFEISQLRLVLSACFWVFVHDASARRRFSNTTCKLWQSTFKCINLSHLNEKLSFAAAYVLRYRVIPRKISSIDIVRSNVIGRVRMYI